MHATVCGHNNEELMDDGATVRCLECGHVFRPNATVNIVTVPQIHQLHVITDAAARSAKVRWLGDDSHTIHEGTARHIVQSPENFGFIRSDQDVRDAYLRITSVTGMEYAVPIKRLMYLVEMGGFAVDS